MHFKIKGKKKHGLLPTSKSLENNVSIFFKIFNIWHLLEKHILSFISLFVILAMSTSIHFICNSLPKFSLLLIHCLQFSVCIVQWAESRVLLIHTLFALKICLICLIYFSLLREGFQKKKQQNLRHLSKRGWVGSVFCPNKNFPRNCDKGG